MAEGGNGKLTKRIEVAFWYGQEIGRTIIDTDRMEPKPKVIRRGLRKVYHSTRVENCGDFSYFGKLRVIATAYDRNCLGCSGITYTGQPAGFGIIAVDPRVIPLGSRVCVEGYGLAVAGDIGGGVKGRHIDLGFEDTRTSGWGTHYTDIYIIE